MAIAPLNNCTAAAIFVSYRPLDIALIGQMALSVVTIVVFFLVLYKTSRMTRRIPYHGNMKILGVIATYFYLLHAVAIAVQNAYNQVLRHYYPEPCGTITWACLIQEVPVYSAVVGFTISHLLIFVERCIATLFLNRYQHMGFRHIAVPIAIAASCIVGWVYWIFYEEDLWSYRSHCMLTSPTNAVKIAQAVYILLALDILSGTGDLLLFLINASARKKRNEDYSLQKAYQLRENDVTLKLIFPLSAVHSVTYIVYLSTNMYIRNAFVNADVSLYITLLEAVHGLVCAYTSVPMIAFYVFLKRFEASYKPEISTSAETDIYFSQFQAQLEAALPQLQTRRRRFCCATRSQVTAV